MVPEQHFRKWLPYILRNINLDPDFFGASYALAIEPDDLLPRIPGSDPDGLGDNGFEVNFDFLERGIDRSSHFSDPLRAEYYEELNGILPTFCIENRVPFLFYAQELPNLPVNLDSALKDYTIAGLYNKEVRVRQRLAQIGMNADVLYQGLLDDYGVDDYDMILPDVAEVIVRTYTDPQYRSSQPLALVVSDKEVSDGTFSDDRILAHLVKTHRVVYGQALDEAQFKAIAAKAYQKHGAFDLVVSLGHGNSEASGALRIGSEDVFGQLALHLKPQATVLLASCSSGDRRGVDDTLADKMRRFLPGRRVIAADFLTSGVFLQYDAAASAENRYRVYNKGAATVGAFDLKIAPPGDIVVPASDSNGAVVYYPAASVAALNGGTLSVQYSKASGSLFPPGVTAVEVTATDGLGHTATASFNVTVRTDLPKSQNCNLFDLILSYGALHDGFFDRDKTDYSVTVPFAVRNLRLTPLTEDPTASVQVNDFALAPGEGRLLPLSEGDNAFTLRVTSQSGAVKSYTVQVNRGSPPAGLDAIADLAWLGVSSSQISQEKKDELGYDALSPAFAASRLDYTVSVPPLTNAIVVTPLLVNPAATVTVNGSRLFADNATVQLSPGQNVVTVAVTSANSANTRTYHLTVQRATRNTNANLASLQFAWEDLSPAFSKDQTSYVVGLMEGFSFVRFSALAPEDSKARVTLNGALMVPGCLLEAGENDLVVTAEDGVTTKTYTVNVMATPTITAGQMATGTSGLAFSYQIVAGNSPTSYTLSGGALPAGVTLNTSTGLLSGTPGVTGTFTPSFTATNAGGTSAAQPITLAIKTPFEAWLASNGLGSATSPESDPEGDGWTSLEEYVLGGNPAASDTELISPVMSGNTLQIQFWLNVAATDVVVEVQSSSTLSSWTTILTKTNGGFWTGPAAYTQGATLEGMTLIAVTDTLSTPSRFMRLRITRP